MLLICPIAGSGSRLLPLTISKPKAMIRIGGHPILDYLMEKLKETFPKRTDACFIVGYLKDKITKYLQNNYSEDFTLHFIEQKPLGYKNEIPFFSGLGDAIGMAKNLGSNQDCFIFLSDRLPLESYSPMIEKMEREDLDGVINVKRVKDPSHYGVVKLNENGLIVEMKEKPKEYFSDLAVSGAYLFSKRITGKMFELLETQSKQPIEQYREHGFTHIIQQLINEGAKIGVNIMAGEIIDFGRLSSLLHGQQLILNHELANSLRKTLKNGNKIENNIKNSVLIPPVFIDEKCIVENCVIGPFVSIGAETHLSKCVISNAIVGEKCDMANFITDTSVIGDFVVLRELIKDNIMIGDSSSLDQFNRN